MRGRRIPRVAAAAVVCALALAGWTREARAQVGLPGAPPPPPQQGGPGRPATPPKNPMRTAEDSAQARKDSLKNAPLVKWQPADSVGLELMGLKGFQTVRYKGDEVIFGASDKSITLVRHGPERAAVQREPTTLVADSIAYTDTAATVRACGDSMVLRDASRSDDIHAGGPDCMTYDMQRKEGRAALISTSAKSTATWYVSAHTGAFSGDSASAQEARSTAATGRSRAATTHFRITTFARRRSSALAAR